MTLDIFMAQLHVYYGVSKNPNMPTYIRMYIEKDHKADMYDNILQAVFYSHKAGYGFPDIATIEEAIRNAMLYKKQTDTHKTKNSSTATWTQQDVIDNPDDYIPIHKNYFKDFYTDMKTGQLGKENSDGKNKR